MFLSWIQGNDWREPSGNWWTVQDDYGSFHVYAFTMSLGVIFVILLSAFKLYRKDISLNELWIGATIIVPVGLLGGSFFGKLNAEGIGQNAGGASFFELFAFWKGGMAIHGAIYSGTIVGFFAFYFLAKRKRISVWVYADCIIPNVLVGQAIGRWGNFFNHELFGMPVAEWNNGNPNALNWVPYFIKRNMVWEYVGSPTTINNVALEPNNLYLMTPIFLYESISLLIFWILITFVIANLGKWIGKKPWKVHPNKFAPKYPKFKIWRSEVFENHEYKEIELYKQEIDKITAKNKVALKWKQGKLLEKCNNPEKYLLVRSGVEAGLYFFAWNFVRLILETGRPDDHLFLMYQKGLSLAVIALSMLVGLAISILAQFVFPYLLRKPGYIYEQEYFYLNDGDKKNKNNKEDVINKKIEKNKLKEQKAKEKLQKKLNKK